MGEVVGFGEVVSAASPESDRWLRSPDHQQVMHVHLSQDEDSGGQAWVEVRSVMGGLPSVRRLSTQAAISTWNGCRQNGWTRCHPQW